MMSIISFAIHLYYNTSFVWINKTILISFCIFYLKKKKQKNMQIHTVLDIVQLLIIS